MSVSTTVPAYIVYINAGDSEKKFREHPVLDFLFHHQESFDHGNMKTQPYTEFHAHEFVFTKSDGTVFPPGEASWKGWLEGYAPFTEHLHEARYCCVYERGGGWEMIGVAHLFANLVVPGEKTKTDRSGRQWDIEVPGVMVFNCVPDPSGPKGFKVRAITLFADGTPVLGAMIKRGMVKQEDLAK